MYCSERYSEDLECQGRTFDFARLERGRDTWDIIERDGSSRLDGSTTRFNQRAHPWESNPADRPWSFGEKEPKVVLKGPLTSQATHNLAFLCNDDGSVSYYGGRVKSASRYPTIGSQEFWAMRKVFVDNRDQLVITPMKEPRKRFVERFQRDYSVVGKFRT